MSELKQKKQDLVEELSIIEDSQERFAFLIDRARNRPGLDESLKIPEFLIEGCQSQLWIVPEYKDGRCWFSADSDAVITKGIAGLLTDFYSGAGPDDIIGCDPEFLTEVGITQHLTPNRRNGLSGVWRRIRSFAESCSANASAG